MPWECVKKAKIIVSLLKNTQCFPLNLKNKIQTGLYDPDHLPFWHHFPLSAALLFLPQPLWHPHQPTEFLKPREPPLGSSSFPMGPVIFMTFKVFLPGTPFISWSSLVPFSSLDHISYPHFPHFHIKTKHISNFILIVNCKDNLKEKSVLQQNALLGNELLITRCIQAKVKCLL